MMLFAASIFSDRFRQFTVVFGFIGAGVAFALQEVRVLLVGQRFPYSYVVKFCTK